MVCVARIGRYRVIVKPCAHPCTPVGDVTEVLVNRTTTRSAIVDGLSPFSPYSVRLGVRNGAGENVSAWVLTMMDLTTNTTLPLVTDAAIPDVTGTPLLVRAGATLVRGELLILGL